MNFGNCPPYAAVRKDKRLIILRCGSADGAHDDHAVPTQPAADGECTRTALLSPLQMRRAVRKGVLMICCIPILVAVPRTGALALEQLDDGLADVRIAVAEELNNWRSVLVDELLAGLPPERGVGHTVNLEADARPPFHVLYWMSPAEQNDVESCVKDLLQKGLIEPSTSPYGAPIFFVTKKDGSLRMCVEYRTLNKLTAKKRYPLPRIDDLFDKLKGAQVFSTLDLTSGYQIRSTPEDVPKTALRTPQGHVQFKVLCFGLTNASSTFQAVMNRVLQPFLGKFVTFLTQHVCLYG